MTSWNTCHDRDLAAGYPELLTITKECKEREYRGVTACQLAPLTRVHAASGSGCIDAHPCLALVLSNGIGPAEETNDPILDRRCRSPYPFTQVCEEVAKHCNTFINNQLVKGFSEPAGYMGAFCHTSARQTVDFTAPKCDARLIFLKKEMTIIKIVVGVCERFERRRKKS